MKDDTGILIAGGGIGGLTTALALASQGWRIKVFDQEKKVGAIGYGIQLGPNVFPVLSRIGIRQHVLEHAHQPPAIVMLDAMDGHEVVQISTGERFVNRFRNPYIVIHRVDLHQILVDACRLNSNIDIRAGAKVVSYKDEGAAVQVVLEDGEVHEGLCLVGADGLRSNVRAQLKGDGDPRPVGYVAHRTIIPILEAPAGAQRDEVVMWAGPGFHIVQYPLRQRSVLNLVAVFKTDTFSEKLGLEEYRREVQSTYSNSCVTVRQIIARLDLERRWVISDRDPVRGWSRGRTILIGDAAHPTLQSYAQGAGMAFEDGVCLADCIRAASGRFEMAFDDFQRRRYTRTARIQLLSRELWEDFHVGGDARHVRNAKYAECDQQYSFKCLSWIYDNP